MPVITIAMHSTTEDVRKGLIEGLTAAAVAATHVPAEKFVVVFVEEAPTDAIGSGWHAQGHQGCAAITGSGNTAGHNPGAGAYTPGGPRQSFASSSLQRSASSGQLPLPR